MKVVQINSVYYGSTGKIAKGIAALSCQEGYENTLFVPRGRHNGYLNKGKDVCLFGGFISEDMHILLGRITGLTGCFSIFSTFNLLSKIKHLSPDIIHLHNLHNCFINLPILFKYIKKHNISVIWTLHDCWAFTGHCPYFDIAGCDNWKTECHYCPQYKNYPQSLIDNSKIMFRLKKKWFSGVNDLTVVTPSHWLADLVKQSFLKEYPVKVINNGIDLNVFKPTHSDFRMRYGIPDGKFILLGVALGWGTRKGLDVFVEIAKRLPQDDYQVVLIGTDEKVKKLLPPNIISIHKTHNQSELAGLYSSADLFVNPTKEDNYPTVNMESIACGTPVLTFKTGGSHEMVGERTGAVVPKDDVEALLKEICRINAGRLNRVEEECLKQAKSFDMRDRFLEYINLYIGINNELK